MLIVMANFRKPEKPQDTVATVHMLFSNKPWDELKVSLLRTLCRFNKSTSSEKRLVSLRLLQISLDFYSEGMLQFSVVLLDLVLSCMYDCQTTIRRTALNLLVAWAAHSLLHLQELIKQHGRLIPVSRTFIYKSIPNSESFRASP
jgi:hypothetical protein